MFGIWFQPTPAAAPFCVAILPSLTDAFWQCFRKRRQAIGTGREYWIADPLDASIRSRPASVPPSTTDEIVYEFDPTAEPLPCLRPVR